MRAACAAPWGGDTTYTINGSLTECERDLVEALQLARELEWAAGEAFAEIFYGGNLCEQCALEVRPYVALPDRAMGPRQGTCGSQAVSCQSHCPDDYGSQRCDGPELSSLVSPKYSSHVKFYCWMQSWKGTI